MRASGRAARRAGASSLEDAATDVLEVVPMVMDALRGAMRLHAGEQLSVPQFRCLHFIARNPGTSVGSVAGFLGVSMPTASAMVDRLVRAGAVAIGTASDDRRRLELQLTPAGASQLQQIRRGARAELARVLSQRSGQDLDAVRGGLAVLREAFAAA